MNEIRRYLKYKQSSEVVTKTWQLKKPEIRAVSACMFVENVALIGTGGQEGNERRLGRFHVTFSCSEKNGTWKEKRRSVVRLRDTAAYQHEITVVAETWLGRNSGDDRCTINAYVDGCRKVKGKTLREPDGSVCENWKRSNCTKFDIQHLRSCLEGVRKQSVKKLS